MLGLFVEDRVDAQHRLGRERRLGKSGLEAGRCSLDSHLAAADTPGLRLNGRKRPLGVVLRVRLRLRHLATTSPSGWRLHHANLGVSVCC